MELTKTGPSGADYLQQSCHLLILIRQTEHIKHFITFGVKDSDRCSQEHPNSLVTINRLFIGSLSFRLRLVYWLLVSSGIVLDKNTLQISVSLRIDADIFSIQLHIHTLIGGASVDHQDIMVSLA